MNPFDDYGRRVTTTATPRLVGVLKTRTEAKQRYIEMTADLAALQSRADLTVYLDNIRHEIIQFEAELPFFWEGDGDFAGLQREIERTQVRLDDGLDNPRYDVN